MGTRRKLFVGTITFAFLAFVFQNCAKESGFTDSAQLASSLDTNTNPTPTPTPTPEPANPTPTPTPPPAVNGKTWDGTLEKIERRTTGEYVASGWACEFQSDTPLQVDLIAGDSAKTGTAVATATANLDGDATLADYCQSGIKHRFEIPLRDTLFTQNAGKILSLRAPSAQNGDNGFLRTGLGTSRLTPPGSVLFGTNTCPAGYTDEGQMGHIVNNTAAVTRQFTYTKGGAFNAEWDWYHPRMCKNSSGTAPTAKSLVFSGSNTCPVGYKYLGFAGFILQNNRTCPWNAGGAFNAGWNWCHPHVCEGESNATHATGSIIFVKDTCPTGYSDVGLSGYILNNMFQCPYNPGGAYNADWTWCHMHTCVR